MKRISMKERCLGSFQGACPSASGPGTARRVLAGPLALVTGLVACSSSGSGEPETPRETPAGALSGYVYAGKASGVTVSAYSAEEGTKLAETTTDAEGAYDLSLRDFAGMVRLETAGGTAIDPATGESRALPSLRTFAAAGSGAAGCVTMLSPLTELAVQMTGTQPGEEWSTQAALVSKLAGRADVLCSQPAEPSAPSDDRRAAEHGVAIAALHQAASGATTDVATVIGELSAKLAAGDETGLTDYLTAVDAFLEGEANGTNIEPGSSVIESIVTDAELLIGVPFPTIDIAQCGRTYQTSIADANGLRTKTVKCDPPNATGFAVYPAHSAPPPGSRCELGECEDREIVWGNAAVCIEAVVPRQERKAYALCNWYMDGTVAWEPGCEGGLGLREKPFVVPTGNCDVNRENCKPLFNLVLPTDHNIDATLIVHDGVQMQGLFQAAPGLPEKPWDLDAETEPCPSSRHCWSVHGEYLPIGEGTVEKTYKLLTTYGYEWQVSFDVPVSEGARTYCDVFSGECTTLGGTSAPGPATGTDCEAACARISATCEDAAGCTSECEDDQANAASCGQQAEWEALLECCATADLAPFCDESFDTCQKGACADLRPSGAAGGCN